MTTEIIKLAKRSTGPSSFVTDIEIDVDGHKSLFLFDTGAVSSSMASSGHAMSYPSLGTEESKGASGASTPVEVIRPRQLRIGNFTFEGPKLKRANSNIIGLDFLGKTGFEIDLQNLRLTLGPLSSVSPNESIRKLATGHFAISLNIEATRIDALFDTGADTSVIDFQFIENNADLFELLRSENGTDAHGHTIESKVYLCRALEVGSLRLEKVEMATFDFGPNLRAKMEGASLILGNNVIAEAKWQFDLEDLKWSNEPSTA